MGVWDKSHELQIFLGGSCNPTTWRQTVAIPFLKTNGISYYNPQVDNWTPDVVNLERQAKQSAKIILFVIDKQTRSTVSIVESAYMAAENRSLVLVMNPFDKFIKASLEESRQTNDVVRICDEILSERELNELKQSRLILQCLVALRRIPMFIDITEALDYITGQLKKNSCQEVHESLDDAFDSNSTLNLNNLDRIRSTACSTAQSRTLTSNTINDVYLSFDDDDHSNVKQTILSILEEKGLTYDYMSVNSIMNSKSLSNSALQVPEFPNNPPVLTTSDKFVTTKASSHIDDIVTATRLAIERDLYAGRRSRVLLFVITNKNRGLSIMVLASHFMARFRNNVVLCVQDLEESCSIGGEKLTKTAIADYNRGRVYLCDYATKSQVPVFNTIHEAIECCSQRCRHNNKD